VLLHEDVSNTHGTSPMLGRPSMERFPLHHMGDWRSRPALERETLHMPSLAPGWSTSLNEGRTLQTGMLHLALPPAAP
jgi:hypothetical protein